MWVDPKAAFSLHNFMGNLLDQENDMLLRARFTSLPCLLCFVSSLTFTSEKMYFESVLHFIAFWYKVYRKCLFYICLLLNPYSLKDSLYFRELFVLNLSVGLWVSNFFTCDSKRYIVNATWIAHICEIKTIFRKQYL